MEKGRNELILESIIHQTVYTDPPESRIEDLLLQLKDVIEGGEGGGSSGTPANVDVDFDDENLNFTANDTVFTVDPENENLYFG